MCLITFAWQRHGDAPLLLAANRDEFHARPSAALGPWDDAPAVVAGRDLQAGGTWLGISRDGRFAAVTNIRDPGDVQRRAPRSRGDLTTNYLLGEEPPQVYLEAVAARSDDYLGFNLLVGDVRQLWYLRGDGQQRFAPRRLAPGIYGLSNAALDVPWPKVERARACLTAAAAGRAVPDHDALAACVGSRQLATEHELHGQGLHGDMAHRLSAQFIVTERYGTRCQTTLRCFADGRCDIRELTFDDTGDTVGERHFDLPPPRA